MFTLVPYHSRGSNSDWYGFQIWHRRSQVQMKYNSAGDTFEELGSSHPEPFLAAGSCLHALAPGPCFLSCRELPACLPPGPCSHLQDQLPLLQLLSSFLCHHEGASCHKSTCLMGGGCLPYNSTFFLSRDLVQRHRLASGQL